MTALLGFLIGSLGGFFMIRKSMEKKLYLVLVKSKLFSQEVIEQIMFNYKNYEKNKKKVRKALEERSLQMELDYELSRIVEKDSKSEEIPVKTDIPKL